jgi:hypothetical protein
MITKNYGQHLLQNMMSKKITKFNNTSFGTVSTENSAVRAAILTFLAIKTNLNFLVKLLRIAGRIRLEFMLGTISNHFISNVKCIVARLIFSTSIYLVFSIHWHLELCQQ